MINARLISFKAQDLATDRVNGTFIFPVTAVKFQFIFCSAVVIIQLCFFPVDRRGGKPCLGKGSLLCLFDADVIFSGIGGAAGRDGLVFDVHIHREDGAVLRFDFVVVL